MILIVLFLYSISVPDVVLRIKKDFTPPFQSYEWVDHPQITEQIQELFEANWRYFCYILTIPLDFRYLLFTGGSGSGKTRTGWEVPNILKKQLEEVKAHSMHVFFTLAMYQILNGVTHLNCVN
jgi:hypothetical protein